METFDQPASSPPSLGDQLRGQLATLEPLARGKEIRARLAAIAEQATRINAEIAQAEHDLTQENARRGAEAAQAILSGKPTPTYGPLPVDVTPTLRAQLAGLRAVADVLTTIERENATNEDHAFRDLIRAYVQELRIIAVNRHHKMIDALLAAIGPWRLPLYDLQTTIQDVVNTVQQFPTPERALYIARIKSLAADHPAPARALLMEPNASMGLSAATYMGDDFVRQKIATYLNTHRKAAS